jgi:hypothetical protein
MLTVVPLRVATAHVPVYLWPLLTDAFLLVYLCDAFFDFVPQKEI